MAMFVLVVDTSLMNVSISAVVRDLDTTVSGVQSAIALEALVSAAFILIGSKVGDLIGRKRAYVLGLLAYAVGALAMTLAQGLTAIIVFWAVIGGLGASLLLPAMQSLVHGNFEGEAQRKAYALVGAAAAIAAAVGPLLGGFITTYLSWRVAFGLEVVIIAVVLSGIRLVPTRRTPAPAPWTRSAPCSRCSPWAAWCSASWCGRRAASSSLLLMVVGAVALGSLFRWLRSRKRDGRPTLVDPGLFEIPTFRLGISQQMMQQVALGGAMIALPIYLQMVLEYNAMEAGLSLAPLSFSMFAVALVAGRGRRPPSERHRPHRLPAAGGRAGRAAADRAARGLRLAPGRPLTVAGSGLGLLVSQLNNYTLGPISEERVSEAAGINSAAGSFGLSFGLAFAGAVMLATLSVAFTNMAKDSTVLPPDDKEQVADPRGRRRADDQHGARGAAGRPAR